MCGVCVSVCARCVPSFLPPHTSTPQNISMFEFNAYACADNA